MSTVFLVVADSPDGSTSPAVRMYVDKPLTGVAAVQTCPAQTGSIAEVSG